MHLYLHSPLQTHTENFVEAALVEACQEDRYNQKFISDTFVTDSPADCEAILSAFYRKYPSVKPQTEIDVVQSSLDKAHSFIETLRGQLDAEKQQTKELRAKLRAAQSELVEAKKAPKKAPKDKDAAATIAELRGAIKDLGTQIKNNEAAKKDSGTTTAELTQRLKDLGKELTDKEREIAANARETATLNARLLKASAAQSVAVSKAVEKKELELKREFKATLATNVKDHQDDINQQRLQHAADMKKKDEEVAALKAAMIALTTEQHSTNAPKRSRKEPDTESQLLQAFQAGMQQHAASQPVQHFNNMFQPMAPQPQPSFGSLLQALQQQQQQQQQNSLSQQLSSLAPLLQQAQQVPQAQLFAPQPNMPQAQLFAPQPNMFQQYLPPAPFFGQPQQAFVQPQQAPLSQSTLTLNQLLQQNTYPNQPPRQAMGQLLADTRRMNQFDDRTTTTTTTQSSTTSNEQQSL